MPTCFRSNHPFSPRDTISSSACQYFEIAINTRSSGDKFVVTIGFCGEFSGMLYAHPGWNKWSVGYHSDDGGLYVESSSAISTWEKFGPGSTVGCGIDYAEGKYFFTLNGEIISKIAWACAPRSTVLWITLTKGRSRGEVPYHLSQAISLFWPRGRQSHHTTCELRDRRVHVDRRCFRREHAYGLISVSRGPAIGVDIQCISSIDLPLSAWVNMRPYFDHILVFHDRNFWKVFRTC